MYAAENHEFGVSATSSSWLVGLDKTHPNQELRDKPGGVNDDNLEKRKKGNDRCGVHAATFGLRMNIIAMMTTARTMVMTPVLRSIIVVESREAESAST